MCRAAVRVQVVEEALAMLDRDGPISLPDPPVLARKTKVSQLLTGFQVPVGHSPVPRRVLSGRAHPAQGPARPVVPV